MVEEEINLIVSSEEEEIESRRMKPRNHCFQGGLLYLSHLKISLKDRSVLRNMTEAFVTKRSICIITIL